MENRAEAAYEECSPQNPPPAYGQPQVNYGPPPPKGQGPAPPAYAPAPEGCCLGEHQPGYVQQLQGYVQQSQGFGPPPSSGYVPRPPGYGPVTGEGQMVITQQPANNLIVQPAARPPDYLILSLVSCVFCFPIATISLIFSCASRFSFNAGKVEEARRNGVYAKNIATSAIVAGGICTIISMFL